MSGKLSDGEQNNLAVDLMVNHQSYTEEEFDERYDLLDRNYREQVSDSIREEANAAVGDDHWDDD